MIRFTAVAAFVLIVVTGCSRQVSAPLPPIAQTPFPPAAQTPPPQPSTAPTLNVVPFQNARATLAAPGQQLALCGAQPDPAFGQQLPARGIDQALLDSAILYLTNVERCRAGLSPLAPDSNLSRAALGHSRDMVEYAFFSHASPVPGKFDLLDRLRGANVQFRTAAENIATAKRLEIGAGRPIYKLSGDSCAYGLTPRGNRVPIRTYGSLANNLVGRWMRSAGHRKNIMNPDFSRHGSAGIIDPNERVCQGVSATQLFAG